MPPSLAMLKRARVIATILLLGEIIFPCSRCSKKGLVYIVIAEPLGYQPSFCAECTKVNICLSYNIHSVPNTKCIFLIS